MIFVVVLFVFLYFDLNINCCSFRNICYSGSNTPCITNSNQENNEENFPLVEIQEQRHSQLTEVSTCHEAPDSLEVSQHLVSTKGIQATYVEIDLIEGNCPEEKLELYSENGEATVALSEEVLV